MGGPDRLSRADIAAAVAEAHGYDTGLILRVPSASGAPPPGRCLLVRGCCASWCGGGGDPCPGAGGGCSLSFPSPADIPLTPLAHPTLAPCPALCAPAVPRPFPSPADISMRSGRLEAALHAPLTPFREGLGHIFSAEHQH